MKTGNITHLAPDGGYSSQNGYIYTFQMSIATQEGTISGEIGSKSQDYPLSLGQEITVEVKNTEHGWKFKKVNPQYQQGGGQPQGGRGGGKKDDAVQLYIIRQSSVKSAVDFLGEGDYQAKQVIDVAEEFVQYVLNGPTKAGVNQNQQQQYDNAGQYQGDDPPPPTDDDIPF